MAGHRENKLSLLSTPKFEAFCVYNADFMGFRGRVVDENLFKKFNPDISKCVFMQQFHSNIVRVFDEKYEKDENCDKNASDEKNANYKKNSNDEKDETLRRCDGLVCAQKGVALCVLSADCLPLLLYHASGIIIALHSGRAGCFSNILAGGVSKAKELFKMRLNAQESEFSSQNSFKNALESEFKNEDFTLIIAPGICAQNYEISGEVLDYAKEHFKPFLEQNRLDLKALVKAQAKELGIKDIKDCEICSFEDERFYSYRRDKTPKRFVSVIYLKA